MFTEAFSSSQSSPTINLDDFLGGWDKNYREETEKCELFNQKILEKWDLVKISYFIKLFYHVRGHFHNFLWYVGNHAQSKEVKQIIIDNISSELNGSALSHEQLYIDFAKTMGVAIDQEFATEKHYLPFIKEFNQGHIIWLNQRNSKYHIAALAAYERLDNLDYINLLELAKKIRTPSKGQIFFKIHTKVDHFNPLKNLLEDIWQENSSIVREAFKFIANHQITLWYNLEKVVSQMIVNN